MLLTLAGSVLAGLAGCTGASDSDSNGTPTPTADGTPTPTPEETSAATPDGATDESSEETVNGWTAAVDISQASYVVGAGPAESHSGLSRREQEPKPIETLPEPIADALEEAQEGGFETDKPDESLLAAIDEIRLHPHHHVSELNIQIDDTAYVADLQLPELEVKLDDETLEEYDDERAFGEDDSADDEDVSKLLHQVAPPGSPQLTRMPYIRAQVPAEIEAFLESYDYVEDYRGVSPIVVERHNWDPPYTIELREFTDEDRWGQEIHDADEPEDDLRQFIEAVLESGGGIESPPFVTDDVPASYFETVPVESEGGVSSPLFRIDDTVYYVNVSEASHEIMPITVTAETVEPTEDGLARFSLTVEVTDQKPDVTVETDEPVRVRSRVGLPTPLWISDDGEYHLLYSDRYEVPVVSDGDDASWSLPAGFQDRYETAVGQDMSVGETLTGTYIVPETVPEGPYTLAARLTASWYQDTDDCSTIRGIYPFTVELILTEP